VGETFAEAWRLFKDRFWLLLCLMGVGGAASLLVCLVPFAPAVLLGNRLGWIPTLTLAFLASLSAVLWMISWGQVAMIEAVLDRSVKPSWERCYRASWSKVAPFSWVCILYMVALSGGFFFFLLPGVFLAVALALAPLVCVAERAGAMDSLSQSLELSRGRWWPLFGRLSLCCLAGFLPSLIPWIGWLAGPLLAPFAMTAAVIVYQDLKALPPRTRPASPWGTRLPLAAAAAGLLIACWLSVRTISLAAAAAPMLKQRFSNLMTQPMDPARSQQLLSALENGSTKEQIAQIMQMFEVANSTAATPEPR
jgi:hypothetical protein